MHNNVPGLATLYFVNNGPKWQKSQRDYPGSVGKLARGQCPGVRGTYLLQPFLYGISFVQDTQQSFWIGDGSPASLICLCLPLGIFLPSDSHVATHGYHGDHDPSPVREPKKVGKLVDHCNFPFSNAVTLIWGEIFCMVGAHRMGGGARWMWKSGSPTVFSEFSHFSVPLELSCLHT